MSVIFWLSLAVIIYVYVGYPLVLAAWAQFTRSTQYDDTHTPTVSLVIAAYNEEKVLREKLDNSLALDYPTNQLEIMVVSDGSTDATDDIVASYMNRGVQLRRVSPRGGNTRALNRAIPQTQGEIIVLSDANTMFQSNAIRKLVRHFADPRVGAVSGDVRLVNAAEAHAQSEGLYYRYERWLQCTESRVGSIIGADGGMYAIARHCFRPPPDEVVVDDFVISMTVARLGYRVLLEPEAIAVEESTSSSHEEFRRKIRIVAGGIQALLLRQGLPRWRQPFLLLCYVSHKLLRWMVPVFLVLLLLTSIGLGQSSMQYRMSLLLQVLFYGIAVGYATNESIFCKLPWSAVSYYFCLVNGAALIGCCKGLFGMQGAAWQRTLR